MGTGNPAVLQVKLVVIPQGWSGLLRGYRGDGTDFHGSTAVVNVRKLQTYYATQLQFAVSTQYLLASVVDWKPWVPCVSTAILGLWCNVITWTPWLTFLRTERTSPCCGWNLHKLLVAFSGSQQHQHHQRGSSTQLAGLWTIGARRWVVTVRTDLSN